MSLTYAGIGSRKTPKDVLVKMTKVAKSLAKMNCTLRSGGAKGADQAFFEGINPTKDKVEIYIPYNNFNKFTFDMDFVYGPPTKESRILSSQFHPVWEHLGYPARDFMGRNAYQILGFDLKTFSDFVLCWTPNGEAIGGTGQAIRIANHYDIPVLNFGKHTDEEINSKVLQLYNNFNT